MASLSAVASVISSSSLSPPPSPPLALSLDTLKSTFSLDVARAEGRPLIAPLRRPFAISTSTLGSLSNVAVRVELRGGAVGWGEAPVLPHVTAEDHSTALAAAARACQMLVEGSPRTLGMALDDVGQLLPGHRFASARAGVEMALIDAVATSIRIPLYKLFGGKSNSVTTDITIPIVSPSEASEMAAEYYKQGFKTLKLKVGKDLDADVEVLKAIRLVHPCCTFILDATEGFSAREAVEVLERLHELGVTPALFEQPVQRDDWEGLAHVSRIARDKYGVSVAADESCMNLEDAHRIIKENLAHVINIKLAKLGVVGALEVIRAVKNSSLSLMIGGMLETRLAMGFAGHLAAGLGCFSFVDLDAPLLISEDPVLGSYEACGSIYKFSNSRGHGGFLHWGSIQ